jgi:hypothetical protein
MYVLVIKADTISILKRIGKEDMAENLGKSFAELEENGMTGGLILENEIVNNKIKQIRLKVPSRVKDGEIGIKTIMDKLQFKHAA